MYGLPIWGFATQGRLNVLLVKQKKAIRKIYNLQYRQIIWSEWRLTVIAATVRIVLVDILDLSEVDIPAGVLLRMVKELDLQLALGMNEWRKTGSLPVYDIVHRWGVGGSNLGQTQS